MPTQTNLSRVESFPFDSRSDGYDADGYPVYDRAVGASMLRATFEKFFSDGVFPSPGDALQISKGSGLTVTIQPGIFIIRGAMGGYLTDAHSLTLDTAAPQGNVCYGVMLRYDENEQYRSCYIRVVRGDAASTPKPPAPDQSTPGVMEYRLGYVTVPTGATDLASATVTNEKGLAVCPYAAPFEEIDLSQIVADAKNQAQEATDAFIVYAQKYYDLVASALDGTTAGELQEQIDAISPAQFVDNVTLSQTSDGKMQVKTGGIGTSQIADASVTTGKLPDGSVTSSKLAQSAFTDDAASTADSSQKIAATPKMVSDFYAEKQSIKNSYSYYAGTASTFTGYFNFQSRMTSNSGFVLSTNSATVNDDVSVVISVSLVSGNDFPPGIQFRVNDETVFSIGETNVRYGSYSYTVGLNLSAGDVIKIYRKSASGNPSATVRMESM